MISWKRGEKDMIELVDKQLPWRRCEGSSAPRAPRAVAYLTISSSEIKRLQACKLRLASVITLRPCLSLSVALCHSKIFNATVLVRREQKNLQSKYTVP